VRYLPLSPELKPLVPYKSKPELGFADGLEAGDWINDAREQGYGIGLLLDNSNLLVVDTDSSIVFGAKTTTVKGWECFRDVCTGLGLPGIPYTFTVRTRTPEHFHFYFRQSGKYPVYRTLIHSKIEQTDVKVNGYVVSHYTEGYDVVRDTEILEIPEPLAAYLSDGGRSATDYPDGDRAMSDEYAQDLLRRCATAPSGERNYTLHRTARAFRYAGRTTPQDRNSLLQAAVVAGLNDTEALRSIESAWKLALLIS
jgi:hypothetical protein